MFFDVSEPFGLYKGFKGNKSHGHFLNHPHSYIIISFDEVNILTHENLLLKNRKRNETGYSKCWHGTSMMTSQQWRNTSLVLRLQATHTQKECVIIHPLNSHVLSLYIYTHTHVHFPQVIMSCTTYLLFPFSFSFF